MNLPKLHSSSFLSALKQDSLLWYATLHQVQLTEMNSLEVNEILHWKFCEEMEQFKKYKIFGMYLGAVITPGFL